ncbi:MAG: type II secretion system F family protein [Kiritimatiellaeota bacterium]|nr:type II secretion system F family protein [Kiritimatiellota bacterium]
MSREHANIVDFYKQLSLLVDSNLPLPEAITQLGSSFRNGDFKTALFDIGEETARGRTLSETMKEHARYFTPMQIQMVEAGEKNGNLSNVLAEIADMANLNLQLLQMIREIAIYPAISFLLAALVFSFLMISIIPEFKNIFEEMLYGEPLPWLTQTVIDISTFFSAQTSLVIVAIAMLSLFVLWLFTGASSTSGLFQKVVRRLPLSGRIFECLTLSKVCAFLSTLLKQKTPMPDALNMIAKLIDAAAVGKSLRAAAENCANGISIDEALEREGNLFDMLRLTMKHAPEEKLPDELANLAVVYRQKSASSIKKAEIFWETALIMAVSMTIGGIVITIFLPLITVVKKLGGG